MQFERLDGGQLDVDMKGPSKQNPNRISDYQIRGFIHSTVPSERDHSTKVSG